MSSPALLALFDDLASDATSKEDKDAIFRLRQIVTRSVHLVDRGANKRRFLVVKRSADMDTQNDTGLGPEVVEGADGTLEVATEKASLTLAPAMKASMAKALGECSEKLMSLHKAVQGATEQDGAKMPPEVMTELKWLVTKLGGLASGGYPSPSVADKEKESDKDKGADAGDEEDAEKGADSADLLFDGPLGDLAKAMVAKGGKRMTPARKRRLKELLEGLKKWADEFDAKLPLNEARELIEATVAKRMSEMLAERDGAADTDKDKDATVSDGQSHTDTDKASEPVAKGDSGWLERDLNNADLFEGTADKDTSFF